MKSIVYEQPRFLELRARVQNELEKNPGLLDMSAWKAFELIRHKILPDPELPTPVENENDFLEPDYEEDDVW